MIRDLVDAVYRGDYRIELEFEDGQRGVVDFRKYVEKGGVFERLKDVEFFRGFSVNGELGTLTWADEIDIAPETLYAEATSSALPDWMESRVGDRMEALFAGDDVSCAGTRRVEMEPLEIAFEERLRDSIRQSIRLGYNPIRITEMLNRYGGKGTAERLVRSGEIQDGIRRIVAMGYPKLSVESIMLEPEFKPLFAEADLAAARWRLDQLR